tara:strand:+ start:129 stop:1301 length:1173 start_codon:yes stop_codon:yes gene_type:complete
MKILILPDFFSGLKSWYVYGDKPKGMPAVYNLFLQLGKKNDIIFNGILVNKFVSREINFDNGSVLKLHKLALFDKYHFIWKFIAFIYTLFLAIKFQKYNNNDIVYGMAVFAPVAMITGKVFNKKSVGRMFGTLSSEMIRKKQFFRLYSRNLIDVLAIKFPCDIMISTEDGTDYKFFANYINPNKKVHILYNGIESELKNILLNNSKRTIDISKKIEFVYVGRLSYWKRQDLALKVIYEIRKNGHNAFITFIGDGPDKNKIIKEAKDLNLINYVKIIYGIEQNKLANLISNYDVSLFLYDNGNLGNALWESCFSANIVCIRESGDLRGIFIDDFNSIVVGSKDNPRKIARKIMKKLTRDDINLFGERIRSRVGNIIQDWEIRIDNEIDLIK